MATTKPFPYRDFARRLELACDAHPRCPRKGYGRQPWIANALETRAGIKVSFESVRKWLTGMARPRDGTLEALALLLDVDSGYLAFGTEGGRKPSKFRVKNNRKSGAVQILLGLLQLNDIVVANPAADDGTYDFLAIIDGDSRKVGVSLAEGDESEFTLSFREDRTSDLNIAVVLTAPMHVDFFVIPDTEIQEWKKVTGLRTASGTVSGNHLRVRSRKIPRLTDPMTLAV